MIKAFSLGAIALLSLSPRLWASEAASYDCSEPSIGTIDAMICRSPALSSLDQQMSEVYAAAQAKAVNEHPASLKSEQRGWLKGRDECWKQDDKNQCVTDAYTQRIAELQARYRLIKIADVLTFACNDNPDDELVVSHFATQPATLIADYRESLSLMYRQPSADGVQYQGRNESIAFKANEAVVVWGYEAKPVICKIVNQG